MYRSRRRVPIVPRTAGARPIGERGQDADPVAAIEIGASFGDGVKAMNEATGWIVATYSSDVKAASAGAVPFLQLFGIVAGGWQMARAALAAQAKLAAGDGEAPFYKAKIATSRFYADHILTQAPGLRNAIVNGAAGVLALEETQF